MVAAVPVDSVVRDAQQAAGERVRDQVSHRAQTASTEVSMSGAQVADFGKQLADPILGDFQRSFNIPPDVAHHLRNKVQSEISRHCAAIAERSQREEQERARDKQPDKDPERRRDKVPFMEGEGSYFGTGRGAAAPRLKAPPPEAEGGAAKQKKRLIAL